MVRMVDALRVKLEVEIELASQGAEEPVQRGVFVGYDRQPAVFDRRAVQVQYEPNAMKRTLRAKSYPSRSRASSSTAATPEPLSTAPGENHESI